MLKLNISRVYIIYICTIRWRSCDFFTIFVAVILNEGIMGMSIKFEIKIYVSKGVAMDSGTENAVSSGMFLKSAAKEMSSLKNSLSYSTLENYKTALRALKQYLKHDISIDRIDKLTLKGFERWLRAKNLFINTTSCYMRSIRALLNRLSVKNKDHVFDGIYTGRAKTEKRAIAEADIIRIKRLKLRPGLFQTLVRDIFLFCYYAMGMPFVDVAFLRRSQICGNQLVYYRHKTGQRVVVPLEPCMLEIIERYRSDSDYVFPLLKSLNPQMAYQEYLKKLNSYNRSLKSIAKKAGLPIRLTSYTARHTWASVAYGSNVELPVISKALGHSNPRTTLTYIKDINDNRLAQASHLILSRVQNEIC